MKVGFFDSGLGGLTIFKEAINKINVKYIYLADNKNAPYGIKEKEVVKEYVLENIDFLVKNGCKIVVIACNTATSIVINEIREKYQDICVIGTEPAVKIAVDAKSQKRILVCATSITIREGKLKKLIKKLDAENIVDVLALDKLVEFAENNDINFNGIINNEEVINYIKEKLTGYNLEKYSHIVLGCTHFPLFKKEFEYILGENIKVIDGSLGVVNNLINKVKELDKSYNCNCINKLKKIVTGKEVTNTKNVKLIVTKKSEIFTEKFKEITKLQNFEIIVK